MPFSPIFPLCSPLASLVMKKEWLDSTYGPYIAKNAERKATFESSSLSPLEPLYAPEDVPSPYEEALGYPGEYPYTRGIYPTMYRGRLWTMRQYAGFSTAEESNQRYKYLLEKGTTGLSVAFDLPTQLGYDADDPMTCSMSCASVEMRLMTSPDRLTSNQAGPSCGWFARIEAIRSDGRMAAGSAGNSLARGPR